MWLYGFSCFTGNQKVASSNTRNGIAVLLLGLCVRLLIPLLLQGLTDPLLKVRKSVMLEMKVSVN